MLQARDPSELSVGGWASPKRPIEARICLARLFRFYSNEAIDVFQPKSATVFAPARKVHVGGEKVGRTLASESLIDVGEVKRQMPGQKAAEVFSSPLGESALVRELLDRFHLASLLDLTGKTGQVGVQVFVGHEWRQHEP
ncbi:MAG: hypothetical protein M3198_20130, partial [Actinomycetota bacterium]|nr:hypothetical protein [Actinomycetota bacterium]